MQFIGITFCKKNFIETVKRHTITYQLLDLLKNVGLFSRHQVKDVQALIQAIWARWLQEYLPNLIGKKMTPLENLQVGSLVLVIKDDTPRGN